MEVNAHAAEGGKRNGVKVAGVVAPQPESLPPKFIHEGRLYRYDGTIFEKLADTSLYTGMHKHRHGEARVRGVVDGDPPPCDRLGQYWVGGLRNERRDALWRSHLGRHHHTWQSASAPPPAFEAWVLNEGGKLVLDEQRTFLMQHGPFATVRSPNIEQHAYCDVSVGEKRELSNSPPLPTEYLPAEPPSANDDSEARALFSADAVIRDSSQLPMSEASERPLEPWERDTLLQRRAKPSLRCSGPSSASTKTAAARAAGGTDKFVDERQWVSDQRHPIPPTVDEMLYLVERYEKFHPELVKSNLQ